MIRIPRSNFLTLIISFVISAMFVLGIELKETRTTRKNIDKQYPYEYGWMKKTFPHFSSDPSAIREAVEYSLSLRYAKSLSKIQNPVQWEFAGPINIGGRVVDIEYDPDQPEIVYAAAATGGVLKSTDGGETWFHIFDDAATLSIGDIAVDPHNTLNIYVGTGEANGGHNNLPGVGIYKSTDGGGTWSHKGLDSTDAIGRVIVDPNNPGVIYAAAVGSYFLPNPQRGIYKSTDGGESWFKSLFISDSTGAIDIVIDPQNSSNLIAAMWERVRKPTTSHLYGKTSGIFRSTDAGNSWFGLNQGSGLPNPDIQQVGRIGLALCTTQPNILYALYNDGYNYLGLFKSDNFGDSWFSVDPDRELQAGYAGFSWYFGQVRVNPVNPSIVYVMDVSFMRSSDSGNNWPVKYGYSGPQHFHVDHHALAFHPDNPDIIIGGNDGGINISTDGGINWSTPKNISVTQFYEIGLDYINPMRLYGGTQDNNTIRTKTGSLDDWERILGGDGMYVIVDPINPDIIYAESQFGNLAKSTNGGSSFYSILNGISSSDPTNWSTPVVMDPNNNNILYYGTNRLYRTTNAGQNWQAVSANLTDGFPGSRLGTITSIAVAPSNSDVIYVGTDDSNVWVTTDGGNTWQNISAELPYRWVTRVKVDPRDEAKVYVTFSGLKWRDPEPRVFKSGDYGGSWINISSNMPDAPVNAFAVDYQYPDIIYLGSDVGAFVSFDDGESWEILGDGLPVISVYDIQIHPSENFLVIGTHGRSMYKIDLNKLLSNVEEAGQPAVSFKLYQNYPNPFNPETTIKYSVPDALHNVRLQIFDILGNEIAAPVNETKAPGNYEINWNAASFASGVYFYKLTVGSFSQTKKLLLLK